MEVYGKTEIVLQAPSLTDVQKYADGMRGMAGERVRVKVVLYGEFIHGKTTMNKLLLVTPEDLDGMVKAKVRDGEQYFAIVRIDEAHLEAQF